MGNKLEILNKSILENNKTICGRCRKLLNVGPIYCIQHDQNVSGIYGRCIDLSDNNFGGTKERQYAYEDLAKLIPYPCSNKKYGCNVILRWGEVEAHENMCPYEYVNCPFFYLNASSGQTCSSIFHIKHLDEHIKSCHSNFIWDPPLFNLTNFTEDTIFFMTVEGRIITVFIKVIGNGTYYSLLMINGSAAESQEYRYQLDFIDKDNYNWISLCKNRLENIDHILLNVNTLEKMLKIDMSTLKTWFQKPTIMSCRFRILKKHREETGHDKSDDNHDSLHVNVNNSFSSFNEDFFKELGCKACGHLLIPPIYITITGYSMCGDCKKKRKPDFPCDGARNFVLEKLYI
ncbi:hypothetical protein NQ318_002646 [Aromia moschata]|uniref:SIAH-type domain-containing protein n=1 Tax=Aromia moschata TaxID=1265417 RepID=A0AAV8Y842_9CUCU|nr:hypothetical protein NQ318_002646 [Aromia moschata]